MCTVISRSAQKQHHHCDITTKVFRCVACACVLLATETVSHTYTCICWSWFPSIGLSCQRGGCNALTLVICSSLGVKCVVRFLISSGPWLFPFSQVCQSLPARMCEVSSGATRARSLQPDVARSLCESLGCPAGWWLVVVGGFECVRPGSRSEEKCRLDLFNEESWFYNYLKQV